jgi:hypothetical protein
MRYGEPILVDDLRAVQQQIKVNRPRTPPNLRLTIATELGLDGQATTQQISWIEQCPHFKHAVEVPPLPGRTDGVRLDDRADRLHDDPTLAVQRHRRGTYCSEAVANIRANREICCHRVH